MRFGADAGSATLANLQREGKATFQIVGDGLVFQVKGTVALVAERIQAAPFPISMCELTVTEAKDQSWPGVSVADIAYQWPPDQRAAMEAMEQAVYAELRRLNP